MKVEQDCLFVSALEVMNVLSSLQKVFVPIGTWYVASDGECLLPLFGV